MLLNWVEIFNELVATERGRSTNPLADPLERPEWRGLDWTASDGRRRTVAGWRRGAGGRRF